MFFPLFRVQKLKKYILYYVTFQCGHSSVFKKIKKNFWPQKSEENGFFMAKHLIVNTWRWYHTFKKVLFLLIVCERNLQMSPVLQTNDLSRIIYIEVNRNFLPKCFLFYRFENEYVRGNQYFYCSLAAHIRDKLEKPTKNYIRKIREIECDSCVCNNLTSFEPEAKIMYINQLKIALKNTWNHIKGTYFWRILRIWNHSAAARRWNDWSNSAQARSLCQSFYS